MQFLSVRREHPDHTTARCGRKLVTRACQNSTGSTRILISKPDDRISDGKCILDVSRAIIFVRTWR